MLNTHREQLQETLTSKGLELGHAVRKNQFGAHPIYSN
ncbi:MAG: hypothetical protein ETSY1_37960 [Candidatus Entotheonella factor]|uniref:Uncharacterized protein n=1 Tax=Entotheonella factor TaxID=1429438 RepID=W4L6S0_ENTF1|nr:MAG: hypothetical protein ETSY1_37960 [Candidatus Entotheonella factor]